MFKIMLWKHTMPFSKIKIVSSDKKEFLIDYDIAIQSKTLALFANSNESLESDHISDVKTIQLPINSKYVKRIIEFMIYKFENQHSLMISEFKISDEETMDLLEIASYLKI